MFLTNIDVHKYLQQIQEAYDRKVAECDRLRKEIAEFKKDDELQHMAEQVEWMREHSVEIFSDKEMKADRDFREEHYRSCNNPNTFDYRFIGTGIGTITQITCPVCGKKQDITDTNSW